MNRPRRYVGVRGVGFLARARFVSFDTLMNSAAVPEPPAIYAPGIAPVPAPFEVRDGGEPR